MVSLMVLEAGINRLLRLQPVVDGELPLPVQVLAEVYGQMIYRGQAVLVLKEQPANVRAALTLAGVAAGAALHDGASGRAEDVAAVSGCDGADGPGC